MLENKLCRVWQMQVLGFIASQWKSVRTSEWDIKMWWIYGSGSFGPATLGALRGGSGSVLQQESQWENADSTSWCKERDGNEILTSYRDKRAEWESSGVNSEKASVVSGTDGMERVLGQKALTVQVVCMYERSHTAGEEWRPRDISPCRERESCRWQKYCMLKPFFGHSGKFSKKMQQWQPQVT